jgi:hypothetical protein
MSTAFEFMYILLTQSFRVAWKVVDDCFNMSDQSRTLRVVHNRHSILYVELNRCLNGRDTSSDPFEHVQRRGAHMDVPSCKTNQLARPNFMDTHVSGFLDSRVNFRRYYTLGFDA